MSSAFSIATGDMAKLIAMSNASDKVLESIVNQVIGDGSPKGTYATLAELQTAHPNGSVGIYLVTANGHWYYWDGEWKDGGIYQATEVPNGAISEQKLDVQLKSKVDQIPTLQVGLDTQTNKLTSHETSNSAHNSSSISYSGNVVGATTAKQAIDNLKGEVNTIVAHAGDGTKDTELILARGEEPTLGDRLDMTDTKLTDTEQQINKLNTINGFASFAHMGLYVNAPPNSIRSIKATARSGFFGIELDVSQTSDGVFVLMHDESIDAITTGTGKIREITYNYLQSVDLDDDHTPFQKVPNLSDALKQCKESGLFVMLDLKYISYESANIIELVNVIKSCGMETNVIVGTQWESIIDTIRDSSKLIFVGLLRDISTSDIDYLSTKLPAVGITLPYLTNYDISESLVDYARSKGVNVLEFINAATPLMQKSIAKRVTGVIVDNMIVRGY